ncbi:MAG: hypothetical protein HC939_20990, partial [Pleurocapsa sp. SU_5_0]|nr:hypothetical protein [Pleurocapsa sp. SU_5_0]
NEQQVELILQEQKIKGEKFGSLAVAKGWIKQDTINFFLANLASHPPELMSLSSLEEYNQATLHLEKKYADYSLILSRILAWTGGVPTLTKTICQVFAKSDSNIPPGRELNAVDQFVEGTLIRKWHTSKSAASIRAISHSLLNNCRCDSSLLLQEYRDILISGNRKYQATKEQQELLLLGLIVLEKDQVKVANIVYQQIFNQEFVANELEKRLPKTQNIIEQNNPPQTNQTNTNIVRSVNSIVEYAPQTPIQQTEQVLPVFTQADVEVKSNPLNPQPEPNPESRQTTANAPEPLTRISSIIACCGIALLIPLFLTINNYYSSLSKSSEVATPPTRKINELQQLCGEINIADFNSSLKMVSKLEAEQRKFLTDFPPSCNHALNQLRVAIAPQLGKENRILEAIRHLCKIPPDSEVFLDAEVWLKRWHNSPSWGEETKFYLQEIKKHHAQSCPAAHFIEEDS